MIRKDSSIVSFVIVGSLFTGAILARQMKKKKKKSPTLDVEEMGESGANPASVYCVQQGGETEIRTGEKGQYGVCVFPDGKEVNEWAFFRGEAKPE